MRKIFTTLKSVIAIAVIASMTLAASCSYDDSAINKRVDKVQKDLTALVERVEKLEESLQQQAPTLEELLGNKAVIVEVTENEAGDTTIKLSNGKEITVLAPADSLQYRVVDGVLEVSADGENWIVVNGVAGDQVVADVVISEDGKTATVILADGQEFVVGVAELIEFEGARDQVYVIAGASKEIAFAINDAVAEINIMNQPFGWSAEVEALDETRAVGGKNFVLKINGPAQELVAAGYAAKEGVVSVHFNTEAGACKVAKVNVNLAEITLDVDAKGNITLTNTVALEQTNYFGEVFFEFADWFIGIVDAEDYATYGDSVFTDTFDDWMWEYTANVASTQRGSGFGNVVDLQQYQEGVCEKESYTFTVDQLAQCFWPAYTFEYGKEYIIFATLDGEMVGYQVHPVLKSAVKETYKKVLVQASYVADSATWNNATFNFALAGFQYYLVGWVPTTTVDEFISEGQVANVEEFVPFYIQGMSLMSSGAIISGNYSNQEIALADLAAYSMTGWAPELSAGTEYVFYIYAFNAASEMELYQHTVVADNVFIFDNFTTAELVVGEFDAAAVAEVVEHGEKNITVNVEFSEDVVTVVYNWFDAPFADAEEAAAAILADLYTTYVTFDEYTTYVEAYKYEYYGLPDPIYLGMLAINADGQYVYVEKEFKLPEPEPAPQVAVTSFEYLGRYYDLDADDSTSGGDFVYVVKGEDGTEYQIGLYWAYAEADGTIKPGTYNYCYNTFDVMYSGWDGFIIKSDSYYYGSSWVVAEDGTFVLKLVDANGNPIADYVYNGQGGEEPEPAPQVAVTSFEYLGRHWEIADEDESTNGGEFVYLVKTEDGNEFTINIYYAYCNADGSIIEGTYDYCTNMPDYMYSSWAGFAIISDSYYYDSKLVVEADKITLKLVGGENGPVDYVYIPGQGGEEPEEPEQPAEPYVFTSSLLEASSGFGDFYINFATEDESVKVRLNFYNCQDADKNFLPEMTYPVGSSYPAVYPTYPYSWVNINGTEYTLDYNQGSVTVSEIEGKMYRFDIALVANGGTVVVNGVYEGAIEGLVVPSDYVAPEPGELQELNIYYHSTTYGGTPGAGEHELIFCYNEASSLFVTIDFLASPITAGTYTLDNGLYGQYCKSHNASMKECEALVTENEDGTLTFDVTYMLNNATLDRYHFTYTAKIYE